MKYFKTSYQYQQFFPINKQYTFAINGEVGYAQGLRRQGLSRSSRTSMRVAWVRSAASSRTRSVRATCRCSARSQGAALGGTKKAIFNAELSTPFPGAGNDRTLRLYGFFDVGNVFARASSPP